VSDHDLLRVARPGNIDFTWSQGLPDRVKTPRKHYDLNSGDIQNRRSLGASTIKLFKSNINFKTLVS
jgi:hypothetical protein